MGLAQRGATSRRNARGRGSDSRTVVSVVAECLQQDDHVSPMNLGIEDPDTAFDPHCASTAFAAGKCSVSSGRSLREVVFYQNARNLGRNADLNECRASESTYHLAPHEDWRS